MRLAASCDRPPLHRHAQPLRRKRLLREDNQDRGNNDKGDSFETYHHLLCNMTGVPTEVVYAKFVETGETVFLSRLYFKIVQQDLLGKEKTLVEVQSFGNVPF